MSSAGPSFLYNPLPDSEAGGGEEKSALQSKFLTSLHKHFDDFRLPVLFFFPVLFPFFFLAHVPEHVKETLQHGLFRGNVEKISTPPSPRCPPHMTRPGDFIAFWIHSWNTCCAANNLRSLKLTTDERPRRQMWRVGVKKAITPADFTGQRHCLFSRHV